MITVYGIKNCNKIRDTRTWLGEREVDYDFVDLKKEPLSKEQLRELAGKIGLDVLVNRRGMKWRQLGLANKSLSDDELFEELFNHQVMIKRPVMVRGQAVIVGYDEDAFEEFVS
jgi:Spx/MgsR family transcriptional regulator